MFLFFQAFLLGLIFNVTPGVVFAETIKYGAKSGYRAALYVQLGSLIGDASWAILGLVGIGVLLNIELIRLPISLLGSIYLIYLAYDSFIMSNKSLELDYNKKQYNNAFNSGIIISITNPQNIAYWAALGSAFTALGIDNPSWIDYFIFFVGFMTSSILWCFVCAYGVNSLFLRSNEMWKKFTYRVCTVVFLYLSISIIIENLITK